MTNEKNWRDSVRLADHYKAIGDTRLYLMGDDLPWQHVTSFESGGGHRLGISVSVSFEALMSCGLTFRWSFDLEKRDANGTGSYRIDLPNIQRVLAKMPPHIGLRFAAHLKDTARAIREKGDEYAQVAATQYGAAAQLESLIVPEPVES
jgi:hypothetical protein